MFTPNVLSCGPLEPQGGWTLAGEDPKHYRKKQALENCKKRVARCALSCSFQTNSYTC